MDDRMDGVAGYGCRIRAVGGMRTWVVVLLRRMGWGKGWACEEGAERIIYGQEGCLDRGCDGYSGRMGQETESDGWI